MTIFLFYLYISYFIGRRRWLSFVAEKIMAKIEGPSGVGEDLRLSCRPPHHISINLKTNQFKDLRPKVKYLESIELVVICV